MYFSTPNLKAWLRACRRVWRNGHFYRYGTHSAEEPACAEEPASLFWCDAMMSLQFTHGHSFVCRLTLWNLLAHCSTVALCCVTITRQRAFKGLLQVTTVNAFFRIWLLTSDIFGRWCSETVNADNGKTRCFILCEKKQEWIYSNAAASTSLKNLNQASLMQAAFHRI